MNKTIFTTIAFILLQCTLYASSPFKLIDNDIGAKLFYEGEEQVVKTAIDIVIEDSKKVCSTPFTKTENITERTIIIGNPNEDQALKAILSENKIEYHDITGKWETYQIFVSEINNNPCLFILGSDPRGLAYGVLEISREIGISPWVWWADVLPIKKDNVDYIPNSEPVSPSVQYRGIFLNDEDWALMPWSTRTFEPTSNRGAIGTKTYSKIFELLLRLRANSIWPAMHECTIPFYFVEGNKEAADKYGIVVGTSHCEPMMRTNTGEWDSRKYGQYNFITNQNNVLNYWEERVNEVSHTENIYTMGMRGIHDGRMHGVKSVDEEKEVLERVIKSQRNLLTNASNKKIEEIPQVFIPYKEVLNVYNNNLSLPDDITLMWCDDNHGHITRLSTPEEQKRKGGAGVYYHVSYWGKPHDYLWLASTQPALVYTEMKRAWDNGAQRIWILNVGDIKPAEYLTEFFLDLAWDINSITPSTIYDHQYNWLEKTFDGIETDNLHHIMRQYYHLAGQRKPEHLGWNKVEDGTFRELGGLGPVNDTEFSHTEFGDEIETRIKDYKTIEELANEIYNKTPRHLKPAFFQLIKYPVAASSAMNQKMLYAQKSRYYAENNLGLAKLFADKATIAYNQIAALDYTYNKDMLRGKWELMMDFKPRDLPVFQEPVLPELPSDIKAEPFEEKTNVNDMYTTPIDSFKEHNLMIALNASQHTNNFDFEIIQGLGHSGSTVKLAPSKKINKRNPHLEFKVTTTSSGDAILKVGTIPVYSLKGSNLRYAIVIDNQEPIIVSTRADFLSDKWAENVLRNQSLTSSTCYFDKPGEHAIKIYSLDEELFIDQIMVDFDLNRSHYIIPSSPHD